MIRRFPIDVGRLIEFGGKAPAQYRGDGVTLPYTEATADANTFVCEFVGGASANETGVGLGLSGADLVFTQAGSVGAASGGYRALNGSSQYFTCTVPFLQAFLNTPEWTLAWKIKSFTVADYKHMCYLSGTNTIDVYTTSVSSTNKLTAQITTAGLSNNSPFQGTGFANSSTPLWVCFWHKNSITHLAWKAQESLPTGWLDFPQDQRAAWYGAHGNGSEGWGTHQKIVGFSSGPPALSIGTVVASKVGLAAAPI